MKTPSVAPFIVCGLVLAVIASPSKGQQSAVNPAANACGANNAKFSVKRDSTAPPPPSVPANKAIVYLIEDVPNAVVGSLKLRIGADGRWVGMTENQGYLSFVVDPGIHHLCASLTGLAAAFTERSPITLLRLEAQPDKMYYIRIRAISTGLLVEHVDEDEGQLLVNESDHISSVEKK